MYITVDQNSQVELCLLLLWPIEAYIVTSKAEEGFLILRENQVT